MLLGVYSIKDFRNGFVQPTFEQNDSVAMRNFANACLQSGSVLNNFSEDFELWCVAQFDTENGIFVMNEDTRKPICKATDFVKRAKGKK